MIETCSIDDRINIFKKDVAMLPALAVTEKYRTKSFKLKTRIKIVTIDHYFSQFSVTEISNLQFDPYLDIDRVMLVWNNDKLIPKSIKYAEKYKINVQYNKTNLTVTFRESSAIISVTRLAGGYRMKKYFVKSAEEFRQTILAVSG